jgi:hypothetical protein
LKFYIWCSDDGLCIQKYITIDGVFIMKKIAVSLLILSSVLFTGCKLGGGVNGGIGGGIDIGGGIIIGGGATPY